MTFTEEQIRELIADLNAWPGECDCTIGSKAAAALQEMQQRIAELEDELKSTEADLEREIGEQLRLDAALKEISLGVVAPMDFAKKAREREISTSPS